MSIGVIVTLAAVVWFVLAFLIGPNEKARLEKVPDPY